MSRSSLRVVLLVDGQHTKDLLDRVARIASLERAEMVLVYVSSASSRAGLEMVRRRPGHAPMPPQRERSIEAAEEERAEQALTEAESVARGMAAGVRGVYGRGEPGPVVCEVAAREGADLVVVRAGGRDVPPVGPHSLGPAARFICDHSPCPVLLVR